MSRKARKGEVVCRCGAYKFPHRQMGGACDGSIVVARYFEAQMWGGCRDCHLREEGDDDCAITCQVLEGRERSIQCPALQEHIQYEEIPLYGEQRDVSRHHRRT